MAKPILQATQQAQLADDLWQAELVRLYARQACNARYDARGYATPELKRLHGDKRATSYAAHCAWSDARGDAPSPMPPLPYNEVIQCALI